MGSHQRQCILKTTVVHKVLVIKSCAKWTLFKLTVPLQNKRSFQYTKRGENSISRVISAPISHLIFNHFSRKVQKSSSRNLVREIWFEKSGSRKVVLKTRIFLMVREKWLTRNKRQVYTIKSTFFQVGEKWFCKLAEPLFQKNGCRLNGHMGSLLSSSMVQCDQGLY